jgi:hypothetical protein
MKKIIQTTNNLIFKTLTNKKTLIQHIKRTKYSDTLMDHYNNPRNSGSMDKKKTNVGTGIVGAPACGGKHFYSKKTRCHEITT